jgi:hypothetical protein
MGGTLRIRIACFYVSMFPVYQVTDDTTFWYNYSLYSDLELTPN